jgi:tripartite-type tricarboxylate transporter receptor subunit TctC
MISFKTILVTVAVAVSSLTYAQTYPTKEISLVNPGPAGGSSNLLAKALAKGLAPKLTVNVEDRPGADKLIGATYASKAPADGYTLLLGSISDVVLLPLVKPQGSTISEATFVPVASIATLGPAIVVRADFPANNITEFLALVKKDPKKYPIGVHSNIAKLEATMVYNLIGEEPIMVPYKGSPPALIDVVNGALPVSIASMGADTVELIKAGKLKYIVSLDTVRAKEFPNVPTLNETFPGVSSEFWWGIFAPAGTPQPVIDMLAAEIKRALKKPEVITEIESMSFTIEYKSAPDTAAYYRKLISQYKPLVAKALN